MSDPDCTCYSTIIIGGGAVGLSVAYHLACRGVENIVLLERHQLTSGTSWHAAGIVGPLRATPNMTRLAMYAGELFPRLESETGQATGYRVTGGYWLAREAERQDELKRIAALGRHFGLRPDFIRSQELTSRLPVIDTSGLSSIMAVPEDASVNPVDLCMAYAQAARLRGVEIREGVEVTRLLANDLQVCGVEFGNGTRLEADRVVLCAGAWSRHLAATVNVALPLQAVEHMYVVTEALDSFKDFPVVRDLDKGVYIKGDVGKLIIGGFEKDAKCLNVDTVQHRQPYLELAEDWEQFAPFMQAALELIPQLEDVGIQHFMNGPESFTVDTRPLVGGVAEFDRLYVAAGMNSVGVMSSAGIGRALADWMVDGKQSMDLWEVDVARTDPLTATNDHLSARMQEAVADQFDMHWPFKQAVHGRDLRCSSLHQTWQSAGAVFGVTASWERPFWFARCSAEKQLPYSIATQAWEPVVASEVASMQSGAAVIELSPFTKIDVRGVQALQALNWLATSNLDVAVGRVIYTQLLNADAGIEADVTITRLAENHFRITSGAATRWRDLAYLRRHLGADNAHIEVHDVTEDYAVIGLMGAGAGACMNSFDVEALAGPTPSYALRRLPLQHSAHFVIDGIQCRASRISFVGEYGWEIEVANTQAVDLLQKLLLAGARPMGHYALDSCRVEKAYRHWGHELGPLINPIEAGLGFTIDWDKPQIGLKALQLFAQEYSSKHCRLYLCEVNDDPVQPLLLHDEPVWQNGRIVGLTTSGSRGLRTQKSLSFVQFDDSYNWSIDEPLDIDVAGQRYKAQALRSAAFDPSGARMKQIA